MFRYCRSITEFALNPVENLSLAALKSPMLRETNFDVAFNNGAWFRLLNRKADLYKPQLVCLVKQFIINLRNNYTQKQQFSTQSKKIDTDDKFIVQKNNNINDNNTIDNDFSFSQVFNSNNLYRIITQYEFIAELQRHTVMTAIFQLEKEEKSIKKSE
jgi:hypothetical protein